MRNFNWYNNKARALQFPLSQPGVHPITASAAYTKLAQAVTRTPKSIMTSLLSSKHSTGKKSPDLQNPIEPTIPCNTPSPHTLSNSL